MHKPDYVFRERHTLTTFRFYHTGCDRYGNDMYRVSVRNNRTTVFAGDRYRPSPIGRYTPRSMAHDVVSFVVAYVESPGEFDRAATDREQVCAAWWRASENMLVSGTESRRERA
jgi:hypothetical protein